MPYCAWCGHEVAVISYAPCPHCGKSTNGAPPRPAPVAAGGGSNVVVIVIAVVVGALVVIGIIGILAAIAIPNLLTATQRAKQKRTMADMRTIGVAIEARASDTGDIPNLSNIDDLRPILEPKYVRTLPTRDGWGQPFRYACAAEEQGRCTSFAIGSAGKDGVFETNDLREALQSPRGGTTNFDCDIIFQSGQFIEYPEGVQH